MTDIRLETAVAQRSTLEWTDTIWNPSTGFKYRYEVTMAARLTRVGSAGDVKGFEFTMHWDKLRQAAVFGCLPL